MSPRASRRSLLRAVGTVTATGLAGCGSAVEPTTTPTSANATYGIVVRNELNAQFFEQSDELTGPQPATVFVRISNLSPSSEKTYFERQFEVETGASKTFDDALTIAPDGPTYAMTAQLKAFDASDTTVDEASFTFTPDDRPSSNPIPVAIQISEEEGEVEPFIEIPIAEDE